MQESLYIKLPLGSFLFFEYYLLFLQILFSKGADNMQKKTTNKKTKEPTANDLMKYEIAKELGLSDKIDSLGWKSLTSKESGRIGGIMATRKRTQQ